MNHPENIPEEHPQPVVDNIPPNKKMDPTNLFTSDKLTIKVMILIIGTLVFITILLILSAVREQNEGDDLERQRDESVTKKEQSAQQETDEASPSSNVTPSTNTLPPPYEEEVEVVESTTPTPTPTADPIPSLRELSIQGFAYEDINQNYLYDNAEPNVSYMELYIYDSYDPDRQVHTVYADQSGNFSVSLDIRGSMIISPKSHLGYVPVGDTQTFPENTEGAMFGFIKSESQRSGDTNGKISGQVFHDANRNLVMDNGEEAVYFYKLYLSDNDGNLYTTIDGAHATNQDGYFRYEKLTTGITYTISLSNPTGQYDLLQENVSISLSENQQEVHSVEIPVYKNY